MNHIIVNPYRVNYPLFAAIAILGCASLVTSAEPLPPAEAAKQPGTTVTVEFRVRSSMTNEKVDTEELCSEPEWHVPNAFFVRLKGKLRTELKERNVLSLGDRFVRRTIRATGVVQHLLISGRTIPAMDLESLDSLECVDGETWPSQPPPQLDLKGLKKRKVDLRPQFARWQLESCAQGMRGACGVFAITGVAEFHLAKQGRKADLSEMFLMWAANDATGTDKTAGFNADYLIAGWDHYGVCREELCPYVPKNEPIPKPSDKAIQDAATRLPIELLVIKHWSSGVGARDDHLQRLFEELQNLNPVSVGLAWPGGIPDREILDRNMLFVERDESTWNKQGHGTVFVGYDINQKYDGGAAFVFRNSWGPDWGEKGYGKISLALARKLILEICAVQPLKPAKPMAKPAKAAKTSA